MNWTRLCTVETAYEANFIKEDLAEAGVQCIITNENFTSLMPQMNNMLGSGIQIMVHADDLEAALQILDRRTKAKVTKCPHCNSENIKYGLGTSKRQKRILAIMLSAIFFKPLYVRNTYYCQDCKMEFGQ